MKKKIAILGSGKIGQALIRHVQAKQLANISFVLVHSSPENTVLGVPAVREFNELLLQSVDLVIEASHARVVEQYAPTILKYCDFMPFSLTALRSQELRATIEEVSRLHGTHLYIPHGAILGLDGISDAAKIIESVSIETVKSPKSLGREDTERSVVFDGSTYEATGLYPRNVNVHAAVALAGIGFEKTHSRIISDPDVSSNNHTIRVEGAGIFFEIKVSSFAAGGVTGKYTPFSACGSLDRVLGGKEWQFV